MLSESADSRDATSIIHHPIHLCDPGLWREGSRQSLAKAQGGLHARAK